VAQPVSARNGMVDSAERRKTRTSSRKFGRPVYRAADVRPWRAPQGEAVSRIPSIDARAGLSSTAGQSSLHDGRWRTSSSFASRSYP
jgi:hypothetical protein